MVTIDHEQLRCKTVPGVSKDFIWTVKVDGVVSGPSPSKTTFYNPPKITQLEGPGAYGASTAGGQKFYVTGENFGPKTFCAGKDKDIDFNCIDDVTFMTMDTGADVVPWEFKGVKCTLKTEQTYIECESPVGVGKNMKYKVEVGSQESAYNKQLSDPSAPAGSVQRPRYGRPVVTMLTRSKEATSKMSQMDDADTRGFTVDPGKTNLYSDGEIPEVITISGLNFGPINSKTCRLTGRPCSNTRACSNVIGNNCTGIAVGWNPTRGVYVAQKPEKGQINPDFYKATNCIVTESHTEMKCDIVPGAGKSHEWTVTVGLQDSLTPTSSYHEPILDVVTGEGSCSGKNGKCPPEEGYRTNGGQEVVLNGLNFGPFHNGSSVTYGKTGKEYTPTGCTVLITKEYVAPLFRE